MNPDLPVPTESMHPARIALLQDLHTSLWTSLKNTLDVDKVALGALILTNLGGMIMIIAAGDEWIPALAAILALGVIDFFLYQLFATSQAEVRRLISLLTDLYHDHGLGSYFDQMREEFYVERYALRLRLCGVLFALAVILGLAFGVGT